MRLLATSGFLFALVLAGCSSGDDSPAGAAPDDVEMSQGGAGGGSSAAESEERPSVIELTLDGEPGVLGGSARVEVRELEPVVNVVVTTAFPSNDTDLVRLQLAIAGVDQAMGTHSQPLSSALDSPALVIAYIGRVSFISQSGSLDMTLTGDGEIEGRFDAELVPDAAGSNTANVISARPFSMSGQFGGTWSLVCTSPVVGLPGDHAVSDSAYCNGLEF